MRRSGRSFTALTLAGLLVMPVFALPAMADSDPQHEYEETWHKATGILQGIDGNR